MKQHPQVFYLQSYMEYHDPTIEGETTALYLAKLISDKVESVTRLAYGLQMGGNLDYTDSLTLSKAVEGRRKL